MAQEHNRRNFICGAAVMAGAIARGGRAIASPLDLVDATSIGAELDKGLREAYTVISDGELYVQLRRLLERLTPSFGINPEDLKLCVLIDPEINALATGGNRLFLFSGMLDFCSSEYDLAAVMAHELVHIKHDHLVKRISESRLTGAGAVALTVAGTIFLSALGARAYGQPAPFTPNPQPQTTQLSVELSGASFGALNTLANVGYSREQEYEADAGAIDALGKSGLDPTCLRTVLERMKVYTQQGNGSVLAEEATTGSQGGSVLSLTPKQGNHSGALTAHYLNNSNVSIPERIARMDDSLNRPKAREALHSTRKD